VRIAIGTDTHPHSILEEIRTADILARCAAGPRHATSTAELFDCATIGAASALDRDDIGRLAAGAKADLVLCSLDEPLMRPVYDPLVSLVHAAANRAISGVWVDGRPVVEGGRVLTIDRQAAGDELEAAQARVAEGVPRHDPAAADLLSLAPLSFPVDAG
jgi:cytosine/adenosine deaminase-related metal-dependent hydrolase